MDEEDIFGEQIFLITGATSGIGYETARGLAKTGAQVVIAGRDERKCRQSVETIRKESSNPQIEYLLADLSSQAQVRRLASEFKERFDRLDVLVNNAGAFFLRREESVDGIEMTFALNHLAYFLLTNLLLDTMRASAPARIVNVSSNAHLGFEMNFDDLQARRGYNSWRAYGQSKLANLLFTYELARRLGGSGVSVNALHPGFIATGIGKNNGWIARLAMWLVDFGARKPQEGAQTALYLATSPEVEGVTGKYFIDCHEVSSSPASYDRQAAGRLWQISEEMTGLS
jgi:NAD(P)-dependent dehydrogenase (short-subunit alcohol dehydrogenase family)